MKCPYCSKIDNKVIDSRLSKDATVIRRRRECLACSRRFTTYEHIEDVPLTIIKKDGRREEFNRDKLRAGLMRACEKRNISVNVIEDFINELERDLIKRLCDFPDTVARAASGRARGPRGWAA